jgi:Icc protein
MGVDSVDNLQKIIAKISKIEFDALLISGDLSHHGTLNSYRILKKILSPIKRPIFVIAGNHDKMQNLNQIFADNLLTSFKFGDWEMLSIDSVQVGKISGFVSQTALKKLDNSLTNSSAKHIILALHHPIVPMNSTWDDALSLENPQDLLRLLNRHSKMRMVVFGHAHEASEFVRDSLKIISCPSTALQFTHKKGIAFNEFNLQNNGTINHLTRWI